MNFSKNLSDLELWSLAQEKAQLERNLGLEIIEILEEIEIRRLHLKRGYSSLHEYCVQVLKYSDSAAHRRVKAMRLVESLPETRKSIESGTLNLTTASQIQVVIEAKDRVHSPLSLSEKKELFQQIDGKSKREAEKIIAAVCPEVAGRQETARSVGNDKVKLELIIDQDLYKKIEHLKNLTSHKNNTVIDLIRGLVEKELERKDPVSKPKNSSMQKPASPEKLHSRYIPMETKRAVWTRDQGQCTYYDKETKRACGSKYKIQIDHIRPFSLGGETTEENLRLLCASHNRLRAEEVFGRRFS